MLYETYGMPRDFIEDLAASAGLRFDAEGFDRKLGQEQEQARAKSAFDGGRKAELPAETRDAAGAADRRIPRLRRRRRPGDADRRRCSTTRWPSPTALPAGASGYVVLDRTPFYLEAGGQVSDTGVLVDASGAATPVVDVVRLGPGLPRAHRIDRRRRRADPRRPGHAARRRRAPGGDPPQPHRHAPAPRGAARDAGRRTSSRPARWSRPTGCASTSCTAPAVTAEQRQRIERMVNERDPGQLAGAHRGQGHAAGDCRRRHRALRREVRRPGAGGGDRRWRVSAPSCAAAPTSRPPATSACWCSPRNRAWPPGCAASRRSPAPAPWPTCATRSTTCTAPRRRPTPRRPTWPLASRPRRPR